MTLHQLTSDKDSHFNSFVNIYINAFPAVERRELPALISMLALPEMKAIAALAEGVCIGIVVFWDLGDFNFLEHIAVNSSIRSRGLGGKILDKYQNISTKPTILEVEKPTDTMSIRRVGFYERNGFTLFPSFPYNQPSYDGVKPSVPMMLMSSKQDYTATQLDSAAYTIRKVIYERFY